MDGATFSPDRKYRYSLWRSFMLGEGTVTFILLNPSTADENKNDPTVRRCLNFAKGAGFQKCFIGNIFALRSTDPKLLYQVDDPVGSDNDRYLLKMAAESHMVIFAWGNHGALKNRGYDVIDLLSSNYPRVLGRLNKSGSPQHPLYLAANTPFNSYQEEMKLWIKEGKNEF